jgi:hypothetical protein
VDFTQRRHGLNKLLAALPNQRGFDRLRAATYDCAFN